MQFLMGHRMYDEPDEQCISLEGAKAKCHEILISAFGETNESISNFRISAAFERLGEQKCWSVDYYAGLPEGEPVLLCAFDLSASNGSIMDGICHQRHKDHMPHPVCYYSDVYSIRFYDDGSYFVDREI